MHDPTVKSGVDPSLTARQNPRHARPFLKKAVFTLLLAAAAGSPAAAAELQLENGRMLISRLLIGDDLYAGLRGGSPGATYDFRVLAPDGSLITGAYGGADGAGTVNRFLLWRRSGVVGCDCAAGADPDRYRFADFVEAERRLNGAILRVQVLAPGGVEVAHAALPAIAVDREITYFADAFGCPRRIFRSGERVYLSFLHPDRGRSSRRIFLAPSRSWPVGEPIEDVRGVAQTARLPAEGDLAVVEVTGFVSHSGAYDGIVRGESCVEPIRLDLDAVLGGGFQPGMACIDGNGGIVITVDGCTNCDGPNYP